MNNLIKLLAILGMALFSFFISCNPSTNNKTSAQDTTDQNVEYGYTHLGNSVNVYDEHDSLVGFLIKAYTDFCGSDCEVEFLFLKINPQNGFSVSVISILESPSLGSDIFEKNKNIYKSSMIWGDGESHFGCHYFKIEKVKYVNGKFELIEEFITKNKYAIDEGDSEGKCRIFPGIEKILTENGY